MPVPWHLLNSYPPGPVQIVAMECFIAAIDRGSIVNRIHRWSMMVCSHLQAKFMGT